MAITAQPKHKLLCLSLLIILFGYYSGYAAAEDNNPGEMFQKALSCFNNKLIYAGCDEAYRLNEEGNLNVPPEAIESFCHGPCLAETQLVLNCVDNIFSNFLFHNKATIPDLRGALNVGCTYAEQGVNSGIFNFGGFLQGETSNAETILNWVIYSALLLITGCCYFVL
ncbi:hypothetical protein UlMin_029083 [Ulmus minor]